MNEQKIDKGPVIGAVVFIVVGTVLLIERLGFLPHGFALHFWPCLFIVIGLVKIFYAGGRPAGVALIALGVLLQLKEIGFIRLNLWDLWPALIIITGVAMLWQALAREQPVISSDSQPSLFYVFGGGDREVNSKNFRSAKLMAVFGGYKLDLRYAEMEGDEAVVEASAVFGGGEIRVPEKWIVSVQGAGIFGAYEDKTRHFQPDPTQPKKRIVIKGVAMFGGIEVKN